VPSNKPTQRHPPQGRLLRRREVEAKVGHGSSWLYAEMQAGRFPEPVVIGARSVAWVEAEVDAWIASRPRRRRSKE
jgi:prophage regulatory protein